MNRRSTFILIAALMLMVAQASLLIAGGGTVTAPVHRLHASESISIVSTLLAMVVACLGRSKIRRGSDELASALKKLQPTERLGQVRLFHEDLWPLCDALGELTERTQEAVAGAALRAKELEIQLKVATAERQHAEAIIYSISDAVLVTDPFDDVVLANESAARAFDFDLHLASRTPVEHVLHDATLIGLIREMRRSNSPSERRVVEHSVRTAVGPRTFKVTLSTVTDDRTSEPAGVVAVLHDMTREREVAEMKNDFVSSVSHELRTPLASIKAYVEMLIDGEAEDEKTKTEFYEVIQNEANRLSRLIDDILNISRIESGLIKVNKQPQSLTVVIKEAIEVITPQARQKQISVKEHLTPIFFQTVADKDMLYQAVLNLLSNAVKYTPDGGSIEVQTVVDEARKTVHTRISDTGVGIPASDVPFVFDKFYRAEANNRMAKGTGLGLSLVKQIVETVHGGRMFLESHVGKGSVFGFELKLSE